jgi:hypothetical protein
MRDYPKGVSRVYDNGGTTWDRFTVFYKRHPWDVLKFHEYVGMSADPFHGFGQHGTGMLGRHNGKTINFSDLPEPCRELVSSDLKGV